MTGSANLITFNPYYEGAVPVLIVNIMEYSVVYRQSGKYVLFKLSDSS